MTTRKAAVLVDGRRTVFTIKRSLTPGVTQYRITDSKGRLVGYVYDAKLCSAAGRTVRRVSAHVSDVYGWRNKMDKYDIKGGPPAAFARIVNFLEGNTASRTKSGGSTTYYC
jgi:hypothetical protein